jgi:predicted MFS family arabinose efflux permease
LASVYRGDWLVRLTALAHDARNPLQWHVPANVWGLGITSMLTDVSSEMVISILPAYLVMTSGLAPLALGVATGLHEGGPLIAAWAGGLMADRSARRKLTAGAGYAISALCRLGWLAFSGRTVGAIAVLVLGDRIGKAIRTAPRDAVISLSVRSDQLSTAFGVHRALDAAGAAAGPALAFVVLWQLPHRYDIVFFTSFVVALLGVAALALLVVEPAERRAGARDASPAMDALAVFADAPVRRVLSLAAAFGLVTIGDAFLYLLLVQRSDAGPEWIPLLYTGTAAAFLVLAVPIGYLADRVGRRRVFVLGHGFLVVSYLSAFSGATAWPWNALVCVMVLGAYSAASDGVLASLASGLLPVRTRALGLAWVATALSVARLCSAVAFGFLWTRAGDRVAVLTFTAALVAVICVAFPGRDLDPAVAE